MLNESADYLIPVSWSLYDLEPSPGAGERFNFYQASEFPTTFFGGTTEIVGWDCSFTTFQEAYNDHLTANSPFTIDLEFDQIQDDSFNIAATVNVTENLTLFDNKIFFLITNWIEYNLENPWYYLVVAISDETEVLINDIGESEIYTAELNLEMLPDWNLEDLHAVAIIQSWQNNKILQAGQVTLDPSSVNDTIKPFNVKLDQNYPNPFNPSTTISFVLQKNANVNIKVYNIKGQEVTTLVNDFRLTGEHQVAWNGADKNGKIMPSGIYFYNLTAEMNGENTYSNSRKMIILK
ncbi:MAG: T9SS type A sorting domain-containing protein [Candidatus Cloacimonetes bacterium]|nr:T9SS type A sorting domain-containing protein [Candidatus Cloacimonadota bacterium]